MAGGWGKQEKRECGDIVTTTEDITKITGGVKSLKAFPRKLTEKKEK